MPSATAVMSAGTGMAQIGGLPMIGWFDERRFLVVVAIGMISRVPWS
jgi:hypothetical protein